MELGETVGLMAVVSVGHRPVRLEALRTFALEQRHLSARALPTVLVWSMPASGLPTGRTGKPLRIGLAEKLKLSHSLDSGSLANSCTASGDFQCWIAHRRCRQTEGEEWQLEPWRGDHHESGSSIPANCGVVKVASVPRYLSIDELNASAKVALQRYSGATSANQPDNQHVLLVVTESVRQMAVKAIGLEPGAASDRIVTAESVLLDSGLDSMTATAFVDDICALLCEPFVVSVPEESSSNTASQPKFRNATSCSGSNGSGSWTAEILQQHKTPRDIAGALCDLAARPRRTRSTLDVQTQDASSEMCSAACINNTCKPKANELQRKQAVAKSAARRAAKRAPRLSKAERRAAFAAHSSGSTMAASLDNNVVRVENASTPGTGLHYAKNGDLASFRLLVEERWDPCAVRDRHGLTALQWAAGGGHLAIVEYLL